MRKKETGIIGRLIAEVLAKGVSREKICQSLRLSPSAISHCLNGDTQIHDDKLGKLADLHGGFTEQEILAAKKMEENAKVGITLADMIDVYKKLNHGHDICEEVSMNRSARNAA